MKVILVPVAGKPECEHALKQAYGLADAFGITSVGRRHAKNRGEGSARILASEAVSRLPEMVACGPRILPISGHHRPAITYGSPGGTWLETLSPQR